ncbi:MAG TPA: hypothetical protein VN370_12860 [Desulfitobacteriaceae bacterium]|nr:hypothetical protein [Desulfitobacteriaceae bacterium]
MGWLAVWLCLGFLIWILAGYWEWSVPLNWQVRLASLAKKNHSCDLTYECSWQVNPENPLAEWYIWCFYRLIPQIGGKTKINCYIDPGAGLSALFDIDTYLSCLQRRFPDIEIKLKSENPA